MVASRLDVRAIPPWERHAKIFAAFDALKDGEVLVVVTDHEPRPLRAEFDAKRTGKFAWTLMRVSETCWEVTLRWVTTSDRESPHVALLQRTIFVEVMMESLRALASAAVERRLAKGAVLAEQDASWPYFGIVRSGTLAAIVGSRTGREQVLFEIGPLETFAELETLDGGRTIARLVAISAATVLVIPRDLVRTVAANDAEFARALATSCAQRTRAVVGRLLATVATSTVARVAAAILPYARPEPGLVPSLPELRALTQGALASAAGTVKEVVARAIAELEAAGALEREGGRVARIDREKLTAFVDPGV